VIAQVGPQGEPLLPTEVLGKFSKLCSILVREKVEITYKNWKDILAGLKKYVWDEMLKRFMYPKDFDMEKCKEHVMAIAGKAL
jgi:hypothetical protein